MRIVKYKKYWKPIMKLETSIFVKNIYIVIFAFEPSRKIIPIRKNRIRTGNKIFFNEAKIK
jgi:hypothetical protein